MTYAHALYGQWIRSQTDWPQQRSMCATCGEDISMPEDDAFYLEWEEDDGRGYCLCQKCKAKAEEWIAQWGDLRMPAGTMWGMPLAGPPDPL